jgi:hypothetical protein
VVVHNISAFYTWYADRGTCSAGIYITYNFNPKSLDFISLVLYISQ